MARAARGRARSGADPGSPRRVVPSSGRPTKVILSTTATKIVQAQGDRWIDPFLVANRPALQRLGLPPEVHSSGGFHISLSPSGRIGAAPLVAPASRRSSLASSSLRGFDGAHSARSSPASHSRSPQRRLRLVPGSGREVPSWLIAGPSARSSKRCRAATSTFIQHSEQRATPSGPINGAGRGKQLPVGRWTTLPCEFSDLANDPDLMAAIRWTLSAF